MKFLRAIAARDLDTIWDLHLAAARHGFRCHHSSTRISVPAQAPSHPSYSDWRQFMTRRFLSFFLTVLLVLTTVSLWAGDAIPKAAWKRPLGQPLTNVGGRKPNLTDMIDDGYWQGAPVGGFGAGTLSRTYRGDFSRWHVKSGVHKYQTVWANQFAMFQQQQGGEGVAQVLTAAHPDGGELSSWK